MEKKEQSGWRRPFWHFVSGKNHGIFRKKKGTSFSTIKLIIPINFMCVGLKMTPKICQNSEEFRLENGFKAVLKYKLTTFWYIFEGNFYRKHMKFVGTLIFTI